MIKNNPSKSIYELLYYYTIISVLNLSLRRVNHKCKAVD